MKQSFSSGFFSKYKFHAGRCLITAVGLLVLSVIIQACSQEAETNSWRPNVRLLDAAARRGQEEAQMSHDVKLFYQLLRDKKWHETYERRAKAFRADVPESEYLKTARDYENKWGLVNYEVLSVTFQNSDVVILICKFTELPDSVDSYSTVYWHKEDGVWKCLSAGPKKLDIFSGTRPVIINW